MKHDHIQTDTKGKNSMVQKSSNLICLICAGMGIDFICKAGLYKELFNYFFKVQQTLPIFLVYIVRMNSENSFGSMR